MENLEELAKSYGQSRYRDKGGDWGICILSVKLVHLRFKNRLSLKEGEVSKPFTVEKSGNIAVYIMHN